MITKCLVICTLPEKRAEKAMKELSAHFEEIEVVYTEGLRISHCIGCTDCWMKTPGVCAVKDDFEGIFKKLLKADIVIMLTEAKLGFISHKMKNIVDRLLPLALPFTRIIDGGMRHLSRYGKCWQVGLLYAGEGDKAFLDEWMARFTLNFHSKSLGAFSIEKSEALCNELNNIQLLAAAGK